MSKPRSKKKLIAFPWFGGKFSKLGFILPQLPKGVKHFVDVYGGSAAVLLNAGPYPMETYNDLDSEIVNFFDVLRDQETKLVRAIRMTPYSREEFRRAHDLPPGLSKLERARRFYIRARQSIAGKAQRKTSGHWGFDRKRFSKSQGSSQCGKWVNSVMNLHSVAERFRRVSLENDPALKVIRRYDEDDVLFYLDPPYVLSTRVDPKGYKFEMTDQQHVELSDVLHDIKGKAVLSGFRSPLYDKLFSDWKRADAPLTKTSAAVDKRGNRWIQECVWKNFG